MLCPWLFLRIMKAKNPAQYLNIGQKKWWKRPKHTMSLLALCTGIAISFMVFNSPIIEWNASLPIDSWGLLGKWMKEQETHIKQLTEAMIQMDRLSHLGLVIVCMAVVPALTEEFLFRGLLQGMVIRITKNVHAGIWLTALLFGLFHLQFYGIIPRCLMGALFGYLLLYSQSLWMPIWAHFVNNAIVSIIYYMKIPQESHNTGLMVSLVALLVSLALFYAYKTLCTKSAQKEIRT